MEEFSRGIERLSGGGRGRGKKTTRDVDQRSIAEATLNSTFFEREQGKPLLWALGVLDVVRETNKFKGFTLNLHSEPPPMGEVEVGRVITELAALNPLRNGNTVGDKTPPQQGADDQNADSNVQPIE